jgi:hypothetical protein
MPDTSAEDGQGGAECGEVQTGSQAGLVLGVGRAGAQKRKRRQREWTEALADKFIAVLADSCNVAMAARAIKRSVNSAYDRRTKDAAFRGAWDKALAIGYARLEMMMLERALHGVEKVVTLKSGESRIMREYNDRVALALLRHHRDSVSAYEAGVDDEEYRDACERIIEKLARLRERELLQEPVETKRAPDAIGLIAIAIRMQRSERRAGARP